MVKRLKESGHFPVVKAGLWRTLYEELYGVKLATKDEAYKKLKKMVENAKTKYKKENPTAERKQEDALESLRLNTYFGDATRDELLEMHVALKRHWMEL